MIQFGIGTLKADAPEIVFGHLQNFSIDFTFEEAMLYSGSALYPQHISVHTGAVEGKAEFADLNGAVFEKLLGGTRTGGSVALDNTSYPGTWELYWTMETDSHSFLITANKCRSSKLSLGFARTDYVIPNFDFKCYADDDGDVFTIDCEDWS